MIPTKTSLPQARRPQRQEPPFFGFESWELTTLGLLLFHSIQVGSADHLLATLEDTATQIDRALGISRSPETEPEDVARLIDAEDNEFVISNPKNGAMELQQDLQVSGGLV